MRGRTAARIGAAVLAMASLTAAAPERPRAVPHSRFRPRPAIIAITEGSGVNVLHRDFRTRDGEDVELPDTAPTARVVQLPRGGGFTERLARAQEGPLGNLDPGTLYYISGTRLLVYVPTDAGDFDLLTNMEHATGTISAAAGLRHGTNPNALVVYVPASTGGWRWIRHQRWIDVVSVSYYTVVSPQPRCDANRFIRAIAREGRVVFAAAGNAEQAGLASSPAGAAGAYQVGGVDSQGRPYSPASSPTAVTVGGTATRPYETGDRMEFPAAAHDSQTGSQDFGGTSGATPSTAGRATLLIEHARKILRSSSRGVVRGALARASGAPTGRPAHGPLTDGDLTGAELTELLHEVAIPYTPASPLRYFLEGYGALHSDAIERARRVLEGQETVLERADDDAQHDHWERVREDALQKACGS